MVALDVRTGAAGEGGKPGAARLQAWGHAFSGATPVQVPSSKKIPVSESLPVLLTPDEVAGLLRTSRRAIYAMAGRGQLPGQVRLGRRLLFRREALVEFLSESSVASPGEKPE